MITKTITLTDQQWKNVLDLATWGSVEDCDGRHTAVCEESIPEDVERMDSLRALKQGLLDA